MGNLFGRCLVGLLAAVFLTCAKAETIPATQSGNYWFSAETASCGNSLAASCIWQQAIDADCAAAAAQNGWGFHSATGAEPSSGAGDYLCRVLIGGNPSSLGTKTVLRGSVAVTCPAGQGWTLDGQSCTRPDCAAGEDRNAQGVCVKDCTAKQGMSLPNTHYETDTNGNGAFGGCRINCGTSQKLGINASGTNTEQTPTYTGFYHVSTSCRYTGASAVEGDYNSNGTGENLSTNDPKKPSDCMGSGMGYVTSSTGKTTCVGAGSAPEGNKPVASTSNQTKESGTPGADGSPDPTAPDYKKEEIKTTSSGGETSTTKTTSAPPTNDANGNPSCPSGYTLNGSWCEKKETVKQSTSSYCKDNPEAQACNGSDTNTKSTFGGTCEAGFTCDGDAATCAIAKAVWETNCVFVGDDKTGLSDKGNPGGTAVQQARAAAALNADGAGDYDIMAQFSANQSTWLNFASSCPVGVQTFTIGPRTFTLDFTMVCDIGFFMRLLMHIAAYMAVARAFARIVG